MKIVMILLIVLIATSAAAQGMQIIVEPAQRANRPSGDIFDVSDEGIAGVTVLRFDCGIGKLNGKTTGKIFQQVTSDKNGHFDMQWTAVGRTCLRFQMPGFDLLEFEVMRDRKAADLHVTLKPGA